ncbi:unnamed protein product [Sympodiomycopsis kandeliae]
MSRHLSIATISALPFRPEEEEDPSPVYSSFPSSPSESVCSLFAKSNEVPLELDPEAARLAAASSLDLNVCLSLIDSGAVDSRSGKGLRQRAVVIEEERKRREYHSQRIKQQQAADEASGLPSYRSATGEAESSYDSDPIPSSHLSRVFKTSRQSFNKRRAKTDQAHAAWNKLGVDSRKILRNGGKIPNFHNPPRCTLEEWKRGLKRFESCA